MNSRRTSILVTLGGLTLTSLVLRPLETAAVGACATPGPGKLPGAGGSACEPAMMGELLGGFRAAAADLLWLEAHQAVDARNPPAAAALLQAVSQVDPRPLYFWLNGARIMAYDLPAWRIAAAGGGAQLPRAEQLRITQEQAELALRHLEQAMAFHPRNAALWIERANIQLNRLGDLAGAAESYRRAAEQPDAPYFAARLQAELLRRLGRKAEALAWLIQLHPRLPPDEAAAGADLVLARIRDLERELGVPAGQCYCTPRQGPE